MAWEAGRFPLSFGRTTMEIAPIAEAKIKILKNIPSQNSEGSHGFAPKLTIAPRAKTISPQLKLNFTGYLLMEKKKIKIK